MASSDEPEIENLVFEGGGVKGILYTGALQGLESLGVLKRVKRVAGASAGSQVAALVALDAPASLVKKIVMDMNFSACVDGTPLTFIPNLHYSYGLNKGDVFMSQIEESIGSVCGDPHISFSQIKERFGKELYITATNLSLQRSEVFGPETHPDMSVSLACRISSSIPVFFAPIVFNGSYYVDGGVLNNFPITMFDEGTTPNPKTLGLRIDEDDTNDCLAIDSFPSFLAAYGQTLRATSNRRFQKDSEFRTIMLNSHQVKTCDFNLTQMDKELLYATGMSASMSFIAAKYPSLAMAASLPTLWSFEILSSNIKGGSEKNLYYLNISLGDLRYSTYSTEGPLPTWNWPINVTSSLLAADKRTLCVEVFLQKKLAPDRFLATGVYNLNTIIGGKSFNEYAPPHGKMISIPLDHDMGEVSMRVLLEHHSVDQDRRAVFSKMKEFDQVSFNVSKAKFDQLSNFVTFGESLHKEEHQLDWYEVEIVGARNLPRKSLTQGSSSVYACVWVSAPLAYHKPEDRSQVITTRTIESINPVWNDSYCFGSSSSEDVLHIRLYHDNRVLKDIYMGDALFKLPKNEKESSKKKWIPLWARPKYYRSKVSGEICLVVKKVTGKKLPKGTAPFRIGMVLEDSATSPVQYSRLDTEIRIDSKFPVSTEMREVTQQIIDRRKSVRVEETDRHRGNVLGVLKGTFTMDHLQRLPMELRKGLLEKEISYDAVFRLTKSADAEGQCGLKINVGYNQDCNFHFIPFRDSYFIDSKEDIGMIGDVEEGGSALIKNVLKSPFQAACLAKDFLSYKHDAPEDAEWSNTILSTMVAHEVGQVALAKFSLVPANPICPSKSEEKSSLERFLENLGQKEFVYNFCVQFATEAESEADLRRDTTVAWSGEIVPLGRLTLSKQKVDSRSKMSDLFGRCSVSMRDRIAFDPGKTLHPMFGDIGRFRRYLYPRYNRVYQELMWKIVDPPTCPFSDHNHPREDYPIFYEDELVEADNTAALRLLTQYGMDRFTKAMGKLFPGVTISTLEEHAKTEKFVGPPHLQAGDVETKTLKLGSITLELPYEDEDVGEPSFMNTMIYRVLTNELLFPIDDRVTDITEDDQKKLWGQMGWAQIFNIIPPNQVFTEEEYTSDEAVTKWAFSGTGNPSLRGTDDGFILDFSCMVKCEMRSDQFLPLGAIATFDKTPKLLKIHVSYEDKEYKPGDGEKWELAKFILKSSGLNWNILIDHLSSCHLLVSSVVASAYLNYIPVEHPLRRLIKPFLFAANWINQMASVSLTPRSSIIHHCTGFKYEEGIVKLIEMGVKESCIWMPKTDLPSLYGKHIGPIMERDACPILTDGLQLYQIFEDFVLEYLEGSGKYPSDEDVAKDEAVQGFAGHIHAHSKLTKYATPETLKTRKDLARVVATFMVTVTGQHELVGNIGEYVIQNKFCAMRVRPGKTVWDLQSWAIVVFFFGLTTFRNPSLYGTTFERVFVEEWQQKAWANLQKRLKEMSDQLAEKNKSRPFGIHRAFDPLVLECSISV